MSGTTTALPIPITPNRLPEAPLPLETTDLVVVTRGATSGQANVAELLAVMFPATQTSPLNGNTFDVGYAFLYNGLSPAAEWTKYHGGYATQVLVAGLAIPSTATNTEADAGYFYVTNDSSYTIGVACGFEARSLCAGASIFVQNWTVDDNQFACSITELEIDTNVSAGSGLYSMAWFSSLAPGVNYAVGLNFAVAYGSEAYDSVFVTAAGACSQSAVLLGQISGDVNFYISSTGNSYNSSTGALVLTTVTDHGLNPGTPFGVLYLVGTGNFGPIELNDFVATAGTSGTTIEATVPAGLGAITITGGSIATPTPSDSQGVAFLSNDDNGISHLCTINTQHTSNDANLVMVTTPGGFVSIPYSLAVSGLTVLQAIQAKAVDGVVAVFYNSSSVISGSIAISGSTTSYNTTSDYRAKNFHGQSDGSVISKLTVHVVDFKDDPAHAKRSALVAHEVQAIAPHAVTGVKDAVHETDVIGKTRVRVHAKGDIRTEDVTTPERFLTHAKGEPYAEDVKSADGVVIHRKGEKRSRNEFGSRKRVLLAKGTPYADDEYELVDAITHRKGDSILQMIDHSALVPDLVAHAQGLEGRIAALEAMVATLTDKLAQAASVR